MWRRERERERERGRENEGGGTRRARRTRRRTRRADALKCGLIFIQPIRPAGAEEEKEEEARERGACRRFESRVVNMIVCTRGAARRVRRTRRRRRRRGCVGRAASANVGERQHSPPPRCRADPVEHHPASAFPSPSYPPTDIPGDVPRDVPVPVRPRVPVGVPPASPAALRLFAELRGRFPLEVHHLANAGLDHQLRALVADYIVTYSVAPTKF